MNTDIRVMIKQEENHLKKHIFIVTWLSLTSEVGIGLLIVMLQPQLSLLGSVNPSGLLEPFPASHLISRTTTLNAKP